MSGKGHETRSTKTLERGERRTRKKTTERSTRGKVSSWLRAGRPERGGREKECASPTERPAHLGFQIHSYWVMLVLLGASLLMMSLIHAPIDQWYLGYVCMVPWLIVIGGTATARRVYVTSWLLGFAFLLINARWIEASTGLGYVALSGYLACYFPLAAWPIRHAVRRRRLPLSIAMPMVWVGTEYVRALGFIGFPWFFLAHSQYEILSMIQISDLVGAYGVSFVLAAVNGVIADAVFARFGRGGTAVRRSQVRRAKVSAGLASLLVAATLVYGWYQLSRDTMKPGPRIAILQQNYPNYTDRAQIMQQPRHYEKKNAYFDMMADAEDEHPDLYLFPETAWGYMHLNKEFLEADESVVASGYFRRAQSWSRRYYDELQDWCTRTGASLVIGSSSVVPTSLSLRASELIYNSAFHFRPEGGGQERHDKIHPVLFGETVPFRFGRLRFLYLYFNSLSPFGQGGYEYSLTPGREVKVFSMTTVEGGESYNFGTPICYEDVMPYVCRRFAWDESKQTKRVAFLLNISNDGWFLHGDELPQHFAICTFRAVENRVGIARSVNTGISGFIDPNGRWYDKIGIGRTEYRVAAVMTDSRVSFYSRTGDVFAVVCAVVWGLLCVDYIVIRIRSGRGEDEEATA